MNRLLACLPLLAAAFWFPLEAADPSAGRPNVLIILADDLGYSDLGSYGGEIDTPHLDRLAQNGVRFTAFYNSARCCPSRASLITGLHPHQAGIGSFATRKPRQNSGPAYTGHLLPNCVTLAETLADAGYSTWMVGKWHMSDPGPIVRGFDQFYGYVDGYAQDQWNPEAYQRLPEGTKPELPVTDDFYATDVFTDYALEFLKQARRDEGKPWFLYLAHSSPHFPIQAPAASIDRHVRTFRRGWDVLRRERFARQKKIGLVPETAVLPPLSEVPVERDDIANGFSGQPNPAWDSLDAERREDLARRGAAFAAMVDHIDQGAGRILENLEKNGELENTLILFTSDNGACYEWGPFGFDGPSRKGTTVLHKGDDLGKIGQPGTNQSYGSAWANLGNTPLNMYKHFCHEGGIASPFIAHWPKGIGRRDAWVDDPAHIMDIVPTVLEAAGARYPEERNGHEITPLEGISLLGSFTGEELPERALAFEHQEARGLRRGDWKIVWGKRQPDEVRWELYNLAEDISEQVDLAATMPSRTAGLAAEWERWARRVGAEPFDKPDAARPRETIPEELESPAIANAVITVSAEVETRPGATTGVILAQGGVEHGWALHLIDGRFAFDVRVNGRVTRIVSSERSNGKVRAGASLTPEVMTLSVNGAEVARKPSPGLIPVNPKDELSRGHDIRTAAGDYDSPNPFKGEIRQVKVTAAPPKESAADQFPESAFTQVKSGRKPGPVMDPETIRNGLKSHDRALYIKAGWIRDPYIVLGPDDHYYLTGTQPNQGDPREAEDPYNIGLGEESIVGEQVRLWRSRDLAEWESLGPIFTLGDTHHAAKGRDIRKRLIWAPEVHWMGDRWALVHCPRRHASLALSPGKELSGPWTHPMGDDLGERHDPSLFRDDDGTVYLLWQNTMVAPLSKDLTRYTAEPVRIDPSGSRPGPDGEPIRRIGHEGATMIKVGGKYVHFGTAWSTDEGRKGSYNLYYSVAGKITGPYGPRKFAGRFLGHGTPFRTRDGKWWCTAFFNGNVPPVPREGVGTRDLGENAQTINDQGVTIVPLAVRVLDNGEVYIRAKDPAYANPGPDEAQEFQ